MHIDIRHMKLKINAVMVLGILFPIAISNAITNHEIPNNSTCNKIGILAYLKDTKSSLTLGENYLVKIIKMTSMKATTKINKKNKLSIKLTI